MGGLPFSGGLGQVEFVCTSYSSYSIDGVEYPSLGHSGFQFTNPFAPRTPEKKRGGHGFGSARTVCLEGRKTLCIVGVARPMYQEEGM